MDITEFTEITVLIDELMSIMEHGFKENELMDLKMMLRNTNISVLRRALLKITNGNSIQNIENPVLVERIPQSFRKFNIRN